MRQDTSNLRTLIEPVVTGLGYELVGVEYQGGGKSGLLRIYIDREGGVTVDDCQRVSYQVSGLLDVEDPLPGSYTLEVSSPGLDRPLFLPEHFVRFAGHKVRIRLAIPLEGRRKFTGVLRGVQDEGVVLEEDGAELILPLDQIDQARLVPEV
jgi:ribosome maturation factor RimP